jgi:hypothetical protein
MNIGMIKKHVAAYLRKPVADFVFDGEDMLLVELNAARRALELLNDFQAQKIVAYLTVAPDGTDIVEAEDRDGKVLTGVTGTAATDLLTKAAHGMVTGDPFVITFSSGFTGLTTATKYYAVVVSSSTFKVATTRANAEAGTVVDITGDGTGASVTRRAANLKDWTTFYLVESTGDLSPVRHHTRKHQSTWATEQIEFRHFRQQGDMTVRYPSTIEEAKLLGLGKRTEVFLHGTKVELVPKSNSDIEIAVDGVRWMDDYTSDSDTDWMIEAVPEYLKWAAVCALNYESLRFASGTDGNVSPPVKARDEAAQRLITWDAMRNLNGRMPKGKR